MLAAYARSSIAFLARCSRLGHELVCRMRSDLQVAYKQDVGDVWGGQLPDMAGILVEPSPYGLDDEDATAAILWRRLGHSAIAVHLCLTLFRQSLVIEPSRL